jgi:hypothetical protein
MVKTKLALAYVLLALSSMRAGAQGSIAGTVYDSLRTHAPLANATVVLVERSQYATTDARGRFRLDSVPDGRYTIGFMHAVLDSLDIEAPVVPVEVSGGHRAAVALATPSLATAVARMCPGVRDTATGVIMGRVRDVDDATPLANATVSTDWMEFTLTGGRAAGHRVYATVRTTAKGVYLLCGVPTQVPLEVRSEQAGFSAGPTPMLLTDRAISRTDFALTRRDSAARATVAGDSSAVAGSVPGTAALRGVVRGADGRAVHDAMVSVLGTARSARTDGAGAFRIDQIPAGTRTIEVRSIGLLPATYSIDFATNATRDTTLSISKKVQELSPVTVKDKAKAFPLLYDDGFETRRQHGLGAYLTEADLSKHTFSNLGQILAGVRGIHLDYGHPGAKGLPFPFLRGLMDLKVDICVPSVFLDGVPFSIEATSASPTGARPDPGQFEVLSDIARPEMIRGIEVYSNPGSIPAQFDRTSTTGCGSIVIWLK